MHCRVIRNDEEGIMFLCGRAATDGYKRSCVTCGSRRVSRQCDFVLAGGSRADLLAGQPMPRTQTCSAWICGQCAVHVAPETDYCVDHAPAASADLVARIRETAARLRQTTESFRRGRE